MMCYRDMIFCSFWEDCQHAKDCHRPLTPVALEVAVKWWGKPDVPICEFAEKPSCHSSKETKDA